MFVSGLTKTYDILTKKINYQWAIGTDRLCNNVRFFDLEHTSYNQHSIKLRQNKNTKMIKITPPSVVYFRGFANIQKKNRIFTINFSLHMKKSKDIRRK